MLVFVYGTLKKNEWNNRVLHGADFIKTARLRGFHLFYSWRKEGFPVMQAGTAQETVEGELWDIGDSERILQALDRLEGEGHMYDRAEVQLESGETAFTYIGCHKAWRWNEMEHTDISKDGDDQVFVWKRNNTTD